MREELSQFDEHLDAKTLLCECGKTLSGTGDKNLFDFYIYRCLSPKCGKVFKNPNRYPVYIPRASRPARGVEL